MHKGRTIADEGKQLQLKPQCGNVDPFFFFSFSFFVFLLPRLLLLAWVAGVREQRTIADDCKEES